MPIYREEEAEFAATAEEFITGTAYWIYTTDETFDADIGGVDGDVVATCELYAVQIGGWLIPANQIEDAVGREELNRLENNAATEIGEMVADGRAPEDIAPSFDTAPTLAIAAE